MCDETEPTEVVNNNNQEGCKLLANQWLNKSWAIGMEVENNKDANTLGVGQVKLILKKVDFQNNQILEKKNMRSMTK